MVGRIVHVGNAKNSLKPVMTNANGFWNTDAFMMKKS